MSRGRENQHSSGYLVLQDHDPSWPITTREFKGAVRAVGKDRYGRRRMTAAGDILCATDWEPAGREMRGWAMAWPSISLGTRGDAGIGPSGADGDPNVGAPGGKGEGGAAGVAGPVAGVNPDGTANLALGRSLGRRSGTSVGLNGISVSRQSIGGRTRTTIDRGASVFTSGRLVWTAASRESRRGVTKYSKEWWRQQRANKKAGGGAAGAAGAAGAGGAAGPSGSGARPTGAVTGGKDSQIDPRSVGVIPILDEGHATDQRFAPSGCLIPDYWPSFPEGMAGIRLGGTEEQSQQEVWLPTDPRLFAVNRSPQGIMGSLVFDLEPEGKIAVGQGEPGVAGRGARLQTMMRVVRLPADPAYLEIQTTPCGNAIAWQGRRTGQEGWPGLGAYTTITAVNTTTRTERDGSSAPISGTPAPPGAADGPAGASAGFVTTTRSGGNQDVCAFADHTAMGPFHGGFDDDKHRIDRTLDGERMHPVHIGAGTYYALDQDRDAPLLFETLPYNANKFPMQSRVHLVYDPMDSHPFFGETRVGMWKWYAEVPFLPSGGPPGSPPPPSTPGERPPRIPPITPSAPGDPPRDRVIPPPFFGRPRYPGDPPRANDPEGVREAGFDGGGRHVWSPDTWGFGSMVFRPQHYGRAMPDLRGGRYAPADAQAEDVRRPVVLRAEAWGKQTARGWDYSRPPGTGRYAGGEAAGGMMMFSGPVDMADSDSSWEPSGRNTQRAYLGMGPNVALGFGTPDTATGDMASRSFRVFRESLGSSAYGLTSQINLSGTWTDVFKVGVSSGGVITTIMYGSDSVRLPVGTTAQRPSPATTGLARFNSTLAQFEGYDGNTWVKFGPGLVAVTVYAGGATGNHSWNLAATQAIVEAVGGGGGGGGVAGGTAGQSSCAGGGAAGAFVRHRYTTLPATPAYAVGAGGAGGAAGGAAGANGGNTTFGALTAPGGGGGAFGAESAATGIVAGGTTAQATGGNIVNGGGNPGANGIKLGAAVAMGGLGGCSHLGGAGGAGGVNDQAGAVGIGPGAGGGGACATSASGNDYAGGDGVDGILIVAEYS